MLCSCVMLTGFLGGRKEVRDTKRWPITEYSSALIFVSKALCKGKKINCNLLGRGFGVLRLPAHMRGNLSFRH